MRKWPFPLAAALAAAVAACAPTSPDTNPSRSSPSNGSPTASTPGGPAPGTPAPTPPAPGPEFTRVYHVAESGSDAADGTEGAPFQTIRRALSVAAPGEAIFVHAGTYAEAVALGGKAGLEGKPITLRGVDWPRIVPSGEGGGMVQFTRPYWVMEGFDLDVSGAPKFAVTFRGDVRGSVLRGCEVHGGTLGAGITTYDGATGATISGNEIHHFRISGDDAHGVLVQWTSKDITIRGNDIHDNSGDSVQCIGPEGFASATPADGVRIEDNELHDGVENAVDIKTCSNVTVRGNAMHGFRMAPAGQGAKGDAVVIHMSARNVTVEDNEIYDSGRGISLGGNRVGPMPAGVVIRRNRIHDTVMEGGTDGIGIGVENSNAAVIENNTLTRIAGYGMRVGGGTNGATENLHVLNNIVDAAASLRVGSYAPGLVTNSNLYPAGATFTVEGVEEGFDAWRAAGQDARSTEGSPGFDGGYVPGPAAIDKGENVGLTYCGAAPDVGAVETGCAPAP